MARVNYLLGRIYRQRAGDYEKAKRFFTASVEYSYQALESRTKGLKRDSDRYKQEQALAAYRIAKNLALGLGWIYYTQGLLHQALPVILTARALLLPTKDELNKAYVELLYGVSSARRPDAIKISLRTRNGPCGTLIESFRAVLISHTRPGLHIISHWYSYTVASSIAL